jgi:hypothetical protein
MVSKIALLVAVATFGVYLKPFLATFMVATCSPCGLHFNLPRLAYSRLIFQPQGGT